MQAINPNIAASGKQKTVINPSAIFSYKSNNPIIIQIVLKIKQVTNQLKICFDLSTGIGFPKNHKVPFLFSKKITPLQIEL